MHFLLGPKEKAFWAQKWGWAQPIKRSYPKLLYWAQPIQTDWGHACLYRESHLFKHDYTCSRKIQNTIKVDFLFIKIFFLEKKNQN